MQSYEGHVNTHSHIQLGVDSSERFVLSGTYYYLGQASHHVFFLVPSFHFPFFTFNVFVLFLSLTTVYNFFISGGEDKYTRIWSIKSGELLFENKFSDAVPTAVCWSRYNESWLGSQGGLFCMRWS